MVGGADDPPPHLGMGIDVDAIWASLKAKTAPSQHAARAKALLRDARGDLKSTPSDRRRRDADADGTVGGDASAGSSRSRDKYTGADYGRRPDEDSAVTRGLSSSKIASSGPTNAEDLTHKSTMPNSESTKERAAALVVSAKPPSIETVDALRQKTARDLNFLADTESAPQTRIGALRKIHDVLRVVEPSLLACAAADTFVKPILKRFEDRSERCRENAVDAFMTLVEKVSGDHSGTAILELLPYAVPMLRHRLGPNDDFETTDRSSRGGIDESPPSSTMAISHAIRNDPREPSEEIRAKLHRILNFLLRVASESSKNSLAAYASDAVLVLQYTADDSFSEVVLEACACLETLCEMLGRRLSPVAKKLAWTFAPNLTHRKSKVRVGALRCLRALMHCGAHETILDLCAFKHPNLVKIKAFYGEDRSVNYFGKLILDDVPLVRLEFVRTLGDWMTTLVERTDHEPRLLPYVLSALADDSSIVQMEAITLIERLGVQYENEHEKELKDTMAYMPEHFKSRFDAPTSDETERSLTYPPPFKGRPRLGARVLIKNNFPAVVNPILAEMMGWQQDARIRASKLLRANLVFLEENATQHCQQLCLAFVKVCAAVSRDKASVGAAGPVGGVTPGSSARENKTTVTPQRKTDSTASRAADVAPIVAECCALVGRFVEPEEWLGVLLDLCGPSHESATRAGAMFVVAECCSGARSGSNSSSGGSRPLPVDAILDVFEDPSLCGSADTAIRIAACRFVETCFSSGPTVWARSDRDAARLLGIALRAGRRVRGDDTAETFACRAAIEACAKALNSNAAPSASSSGGAEAPTDPAISVVALLRSELLASLASVPPKKIRLHDAATLAAIVEAPGSFSPTDASTAIRLTSLACERLFDKPSDDDDDAAAADEADADAKNVRVTKKRNDDVTLVRAALVRFPFLGSLETPLLDADVSLVTRTALPRLTGSRFSARTEKRRPALRAPVASAALDAVLALMKEETSSIKAVVRVAGEIAAGTIAVLELAEHTFPKSVRAKACEVIAALAARLRDVQSILAAPEALSRVLPAVAARLDDADATTRAASFAALAALAPLSPLAAYHCVRCVTRAHLIDETSDSESRVGALDVVRKAFERFPGPAAAAAARRDGASGDSSRLARLAVAEEAGANGSFSEDDAKLEDGLVLDSTRQREPTRFDREGEEDATRAEFLDRSGSLFGLD